MKHHHHGQRVMVEWLDASSNRHVHSRKGLKSCEECRTPMPTQTVGFLVERNQNSIVLGTDHFEDGDYRFFQQIPRKMVTKVEQLDTRSECKHEAHDAGARKGHAEARGDEAAREARSEG